MPVTKNQPTELVNKDIEKKRLSEEYFIEKGFAALESDVRIQEDIWKFLKTVPNLDLSEIEVDVREGLVTVMGTFSDSQIQGRVVHHILRTIGGVRHVSDKSRVLAKQETMNVSEEENLPDIRFE